MYVERAYYSGTPVGRMNQVSDHNRFGFKRELTKHMLINPSLGFWFLVELQNRIIIAFNAINFFPQLTRLIFLIVIRKKIK